MMKPTTEQLPAYSNQPNFVGYPLFYIIDGETAMCACCATEAQGEAKTVEAECNWENKWLDCEQCGVWIDYAYGDEREAPEQN